MPGYVLTWNPGRSRVDDARWSRWVARMRAGEPVDVAWRMGSTRHGVTAGQPVVLLRQGPHGRGLVGRGVVTDDGVHPDDHWDGVGRMAFHARVAWHSGVEAVDAIDIPTLEHTTRSFDWRHVYASGHRIDDHDLAAVDRLWNAIVQLHPPRG